MSKNTFFTPGPWRVFDDAGFNDGYIGVSMASHSRSPNNYETGHIWYCKVEYLEADAEILATAALIAAAPDLYEALASIENDGSIPDAIWALRNKALAKARGAA